MLTTWLNDRAIETLEARYYEKDSKGNSIEDPDKLFRRIAKTVAGAEQTDSLKDKWEQKFYDLTYNLDFLPNTPTIMNAGKSFPRGQLSACFVLPIHDSMHGIFQTLHDTALIHKTGGGTGFDFSSLRSAGSTVGSKLGVSTGPLEFCRVYDTATDVIKQGSSRRGANMMVFNVHHPDIIDFIKMKSTPGSMTNFNVSVGVTDRFLQAVKDGTDYELEDPKSGPAGKLDARTVWNLISECAHKSAEPGLLFLDEINRKSDFEEQLTATNPCGEVPLPPYGSCNLGSINISRFVEESDIQWDRLEETIRTATRFLDNVVDVNHYPLSQDEDGEYREGKIEKTALYYRNIGLGPMGWADTLLKLKIPYNSPAALELADKFGDFINRTSHDESTKLGKEKGTPEGAPFPTHFDYASSERRNATLTVIAPTGTISVIAGCSSGIEPVFAYEMERHQLDTIWQELHYLYEDAKENGWYEKNVFVDSHDINTDSHIDMQAAWQQNTDQSISKTINMPSHATVEDVQSAYWRAYEKGCKGVTVYIDGSREGVLKRKDSDDEIEPATDLCPECDHPLVMESGCSSCPNCFYSACAVA